MTVGPPDSVPSLERMPRRVRERVRAAMLTILSENGAPLHVDAATGERVVLAEEVAETLEMTVEVAREVLGRDFRILRLLPSDQLEPLE